MIFEKRADLRYVIIIYLYWICNILLNVIIFSGIVSLTISFMLDTP